MGKNLRFARPDDAKALLEIYKCYIDTTTTCEYPLPTEAEFSERIRSVTEVYPYLICEEEGRPVGYAYAHRMFERAAYRWDAELSVYLAPDVTSRGIGSSLYGAIMELLKLQGVRTVYGIVTEPNRRSARFHEKMGFNLMGVAHNSGYKCGEWYDILWFEKRIGNYEAPKPVIPILQVEEETKRRILAAAEEEINGKE